jgi:hypothetical protein
MKIDGETVILTAPGVSKPRGVAYGCNGVGWLPNLYNRALLPLTPFIYYDHKLVTSDTWPDNPIKVAGVVRDPLERMRRREILASQFRDNGVVQAGVPLPFWGPVPPGSVVTLRFAGIEKTVRVGPEEAEWRITLPPLPPSGEPATLNVTCKRDGELYAVNEITNIIVGDVWYVAVPPFDFTVPLETEQSQVRLFTSSAKKRANDMPYRFKLESPPKGSRYYAVWRSARELNPKSALHVFANVIGARIFAKTGTPVGIVVMDTRESRDGPGIQVKSWIGYDDLQRVPSLMEDYVALQAKYPDNPAYFEVAEKHIAEWKTFWETVPQAILSAKKLKEGEASIALPRLGVRASSLSPATQSYNMLITSFSPGRFKGVICLTPRSFFAEDAGANFGSEFSVMANCWKRSFGGADPQFFYTIPSRSLAPKISRPQEIKGKSTVYEIDHWLKAERKGRNADAEELAVVNQQLLDFIDLVVTTAYE